jgi:iron complex transport system substrate-binding protein
MKRFFYTRQLLLTLFCVLLSFNVLASITVKDDYGRMVSLQRPAKRIVTLAPNATEILFMIGANNSIVGTINQSNYPKAALKITRVGNYTTPDLERILFLSPDLVVLPQHGISFSLVQQLKKFNIPFYVINPHNIKDIPGDIKKLGILTGHQSDALYAATKFNKKLNQLTSHYLDRKKVTVFYLLWREPLITIGQNTLIDQMISLCGGKNIFGKLKISYPAINLANLISRNPQVIFVGDERQKTSWNDWGLLQAAKKKHIYYISPDLIQRSSPRILIGTKLLCDKINEVREATK